jgi:hypothetical protein
MEVCRLCACQPCFTDTICGVTVFEEPLRKDASDATDLSRITIKLVLVVEQLRTVNADDRQAADAVIRATKTIPDLAPTPTAVDRLGSAVDAGAQVANKIQTFATTWSVLLEKVELFNKIVAGIAEVLAVPYLGLLTF